MIIFDDLICKFEPVERMSLYSMFQIKFLKCMDRYVCVGGRSVAYGSYTKFSVAAGGRMFTE